MAGSSSKYFFPDLVGKRGGARPGNMVGRINISGVWAVWYNSAMQDEQFKTEQEARDHLQMLIDLDSVGRV